MASVNYIEADQAEEADRAVSGQLGGSSICTVVRFTRLPLYGSPKHTRSDSEGGPAHGTFPQSRKRAWNLTDLRTPSSKAEDVACVSSSSMRKAREKVALTAAHTCPAAREFFFDPGTDALPTVIWFVQ